MGERERAEGRAEMGLDWTGLDSVGLGALREMADTDTTPDEGGTHTRSQCETACLLTALIGQM